MMIMLITGCVTPSYWIEHGTTLIYPSTLQDVEDITGVDFKRQQSGKDMLWLNSIGGSVNVLTHKGMIASYGSEAYCWVIWHEFGHAIMLKYNWEYDDYCEIEDEPLTAYAGTNCNEDFAENYAAYKLGDEINNEKKDFIIKQDLLRNIDIGC